MFAKSALWRNEVSEVEELSERVRFKASLPADEVEQLKKWALAQNTSVTAILRQLIQYGRFMESIENSPGRRLIMEEADGSTFELRWSEPK